jgi:RNA polymerase sigma factor (sigma-70 family)
VYIDGSRDEATSPLVDLAGFDRFYLDTARRTLALAQSLTHSWADAEDLVQDAYADAHRRWAIVGALDDPSAWVRRAVVNRSASRWRRLGREIRALTRTAARSTERQEATEPYDEPFWKCVAALPRQQARVVALFYVDDQSVEQIAALLDCSIGTVKTHLSRARASLRASLLDTNTNEEH